MKEKDLTKQSSEPKPAEQERDFKGIWLSKEIWFNIELSPVEKILLLEIDSLDRGKGCYASNKYLAEFVGYKEQSIVDIITRLRKDGYIQTIKHDGRKRWLKVVITRLQTCPDHVQGSVVPTSTEVQSDVSLDTVVSNSPSNTIESIQMSNNEIVTSPAGLVDVSSPKLYTSKVYDKESLPYQLAEVLITKVSQRRGTYNRYLKTDIGREKLLQNNAYSFDLLLRKDKKDVKEVLDVLTWSQEDDFWKNNILSAEKFRLQYDRLLSQMQAKGIGSLAPDPNADFTKKVIDIYRMLIRNDSFVPSPLQHLKFIEASKRAVAFFTERGLENQDPWADYILRCLGKNYIERGEVVYPGHFCSEQTWQILMPQYLAEVGLV